MSKARYFLTVQIYCMLDLRDILTITPAKAIVVDKESYFPIECFYPSIHQQKAPKELDKEHTKVIEEEITMHARGAVLTDNVEHVMTKKEETDFDVTLGAFDGAKCCEMLGLLKILLHLQEKVPQIVQAGGIL